MFSSNRRAQGQAAESPHQDVMAAKKADQLRLGTLLHATLKAVASANTKVAGGTISAHHIEENAGKYSVTIRYQAGSHREVMMQFSIDLANDRLTSWVKGKESSHLPAASFDRFLEEATKLVRDFE